MKTCYVCKESKTLEEFNLDRRSKDGRQSKCKLCGKKHYIQNKDKTAESDRLRVRETMRKRRAGYTEEDKKRERVKRKAYESTDAFFDRYLQKKYNMTLLDYNNKLIEQDNHCAMCPTEYTKENKLHVDHDHTCCPGAGSCGKCIRGLLCPSCNTLLGKAYDRIDILMNGVNYLTDWRK